MELIRASAWEAGCDEAGRGALAGPVVAAAVCLPTRYELPNLHDSKQLSPKVRRELSKAIRTQADWAVGTASVEEIDEINILQASILAMHRALDGLRGCFRAILVDGCHFNVYASCPHRCVVRGDARYDAIAAASVVAKTYRDTLMQRASLQYEHYGWSKNKGYPTQQHRKAIHSYGLCDLHRRTFRCKGSA